jgi:hypothetical protein
MNNPYTYVILRKDLPPVQWIVQASHAALEAGFRFDQPEQTSYLILLEVASEKELNSASKMLRKRCIDHHKFFEPDYGTGFTALCTRPILDATEQNYFKRWNLFTPMQPEVLY